MIKIIIGLICVMIANIVLGSSIATLKKEWNKEKFINGITKSGFIILGCGLMYLCSYLNPNILAIDDMNLIDAMKTLFIAGIAMYGAMDFKKLAELLKIKTPSEEEKGQ